MPGTLAYSATAPLHGQRAGHGRAVSGHHATASWCSCRAVLRLARWLHYRASEEVSNGVGCPAAGATRPSVGRVTGTIALLAVSTPNRAPQGRGVLPPARHWLIICEALACAVSPQRFT